MIDEEIRAAVLEYYFQTYHLKLRADLPMEGPMGIHDLYRKMKLLSEEFYDAKEKKRARLILLRHD